MEGIDLAEPESKRRAARLHMDPPAREWRLVERWLLVLFGIVAIGISVVALGLASIAVY